MRRPFVSLAIMILILQALTAAPAWQTPRVWFENDYSSRKNVVDLESLFYIPSMETTYNSNTPSGTYGSYNSLGNVGCAYCNHDITFTITTTGKFVSESDPTKYRDFYVAVIPRIRYDTKDRKNTSNDDAFCKDRTYQGGSLAGAVMAPNTRDVSGGEYKSISITAPAVSFSEYTKYYVGPDGEQHVFRFWGDLLICLPALTQADLQHISETDDYTATVTVSWTCTPDENPCNAAHSGSFQYNLRGYYKTGQSAQDSLAMFVTPNHSSMNLNIRSILNESPAEIQISQLKIYTTTVKRSSSTWVRYSGSNISEVRVKPFISANSLEYWNQSQGDTFALSNGMTSIPFEVIVRDTDHPDSNHEWVFDGSDYWGKADMNYIGLKDNVVPVIDRQGTEYNMISFAGDVFISFEGQTIPGLTSGIYSEDIYYYIGYN